MIDLLELAKRTMTETLEIEPPKIVASAELDLDDPVLIYAHQVLNKAGCRKFAVDGEVIVGVWSDMDSQEIRSALRVLQWDGLRVRYLDGSNVPAAYKLRHLAGEVVPVNVLKAMEESPAEPWKVRDRMLKEINWCVNGVPWAEWKAGALNQIFRDASSKGESGRITGKTVQHGAGR